MEFLVVFFAVLAVSVAKPIDEQLVAVSQNSDGSYMLKYQIVGISRVEEGTADGNVIGYFSYIDPHGILRKRDYTAGVHGFNVIATDLPLPVADTPEVAAAKAHHLSLLRAAELEASKMAIVPIPETKTIPVQLAPVVVPETPEVAKSEDLVANDAEKRTPIP